MEDNKENVDPPIQPTELELDATRSLHPMTTPEQTDELERQMTAVAIDSPPIANALDSNETGVETAGAFKLAAAVAKADPAVKNGEKGMNGRLKKRAREEDDDEPEGQGRKKVFIVDRQGCCHITE